MTALNYNPLHCIDCNLEIPPESLDLSAEVVDAIAYWRNIYDAIDRLWLDSKEYEIWAKHQLAEITSPVNKRGMVLRKRLDAIRRCYYWYFQNQSAEGFRPIERCPSCGCLLAVYSNGIFRQLICEQCSLITVGE
jgi:predicted  nucleic acid-binding Zn ribbon protein